MKMFTHWIHIDRVLSTGKCYEENKGNVGPCLFVSSSTADFHGQPVFLFTSM